MRFQSLSSIIICPASSSPRRPHPLPVSRSPLQRIGQAAAASIRKRICGTLARPGSHRSSKFSRRQCRTAQFSSHLKSSSGTCATHVLLVYTCLNSSAHLSVLRHPKLHLLPLRQQRLPDDKVRYPWDSVGSGNV